MGPMGQLLARKQRRAETASTRLAHKDCPQPFATLAAQIVAPHCATRGSPQPIAQLLARNASSGQTIERKAQWSGSARRLSKRAKVERGRLPSRALALDTVASPHITSSDRTLSTSTGDGRRLRRKERSTRFQAPGSRFQVAS